jgi:aminoglycoside phosphotransferase (APT) family kinase protein
VGRPDRLDWQVPPSADALAWAAAAIGPGARVRAVQRLGSGIAQATHALTIDDAAGRRHRLVLQRWLRPGWEDDDPGFDPAKEAAVLEALAGGPVPVPRVVALDIDGRAGGAPALLTERLPGRPPSMGLVRRPATLEALGRTLAEIHRIGPERATAAVRALVPAYGAFGDLADAAIPATTPRRDLWRAALAIAADPPASGRSATLLHRDYHAWNTLWVGGRLSGVVDWSSASWGPPAADLAHLRIDLVVDVSVEAANRAREAYAAAGGDLTDARHHQLRTVFDYLGDADPAWMVPPAMDRLDAFLALVLAEPDA